jgi:ubiquitin-conjugating enzyme E2 D/E
MRRRVEVPVDEDGQLKHVRQLGSHDLARDEEGAPLEPAWRSRRMDKEVATWSGFIWNDDTSCGGMLRLIARRQALGAVVINDPASPCDGGLFYFEFLIHENHPFAPPKVRLLTRCYHSGVDEHGSNPGCLSVVGGEWTPSMTIARLRLNFYAPLIAGQISDGSPRNPRMPEIAAQFKERRTEFETIAREWTERYAHGDIPFGRWTRESHFPIGCGGVL